MSDVVTFKNLIGQEIVTELISEEENGDYIVKRPYVLDIAGFDENKQATLQMMPLFLMNPEVRITLKALYIASSPIPAPKVLEENYREQATGLVLALH